LKRLFFLFLAAIVLVLIVWRVTAQADDTARAVREDRPVTSAILTPPETPSRIDYRRLDARLRRLIQDPSMVGLAVAVVENGRIRFIKGYGVTTSGSDDPVTGHTVFRWASLSKGVAADTVALLAHDGRLSLDDPVGRHAPSLKLPDDNERVATVANLLSHTLGLFAHAYDGKLEDGVDPRQLRRELATLHNICAPGTCHAYQNVAYDAASEIVERVTGRPYHTIVEERLFRPLNMRASYGRAALMAAPSWARGHAGGRTSPPIEISDAYYRVPAAGGVNGSIEDLAIWMIAQMGLAPAVLPPDVLAAVQTPRIRTPGENRRRRRFAERTHDTWYGLGWRVMDYAGHRVIGHHGGVRGYRSMLMFDPVTKTGIVALWNSAANKPEGIEYEVMDMAYRLPFRDWMRIDAPEHETPGAGAENEGGGG
jgi:beta-lactamase class C